MSLTTPSLKRNYFSSDSEPGVSADPICLQDTLLFAPGDMEEVMGDGNMRAWMQCLGSFILFLNSWGIINTFGNYSNVVFKSSSADSKGVFQTVYQQSILSSVSASGISWIGSIQIFLLFFGGLATGPLFDHGFLRSLIYAGGILVVFGMMMTSISSRYWHIVLAQGIVVGLGCACFFIPSVAIIRLYFGKRRGLAMGVAASGSSIGKWSDVVSKLLGTD